MAKNTTKTTGASVNDVAAVAVPAKKAAPAKRAAALAVTKPTVRASRTAIEIAIARACRKDGVSAENLQKATGWARRPSSYDMGQIAARHGFKLKLLEGATGKLIYKFV